VLGRTNTARVLALPASLPGSPPAAPGARALPGQVLRRRPSWLHSARMRALAIFGLHGGLNLAVQLVILVLVALWLALAFWTYADARRRVDDPMLVACAAAGAFCFPFVGAIVYAIVRPPEYIDDVRERELEIAAAEARLAQVEALSCPHCGFDVE